MVYSPPLSLIGLLDSGVRAQTWVVHLEVRERVANLGFERAHTSETLGLVRKQGTHIGHNMHQNSDKAVSLLLLAPNFRLRFAPNSYSPSKRSVSFCFP